MFLDIYSLEILHVESIVDPLDEEKITTISLGLLTFQCVCVTPGGLVGRGGGVQLTMEIMAQSTSVEYISELSYVCSCMYT